MSVLRPVGVLGIGVWLAAGSASAQITPEEVWAFWQGMAQGAGYEMLSSGQRRDGASLILDGVQVNALSDTAAIRMPIGQITMRDRGDGTVEVTMPPAFDMSMTITEPGRDPVEMAVAIEQDAYVMVVSGTAASPKYDFTAASVAIALATPTVDGEEVPMDMAIALGGLKGSTALTQGSPIALSYDLSAEALEMTVSATDPEGGGTVEMSMGAEALVSRFEGALPAVMTPDTEIGAAFAAGLRGKGGYSTGPLEFTFDVDDKGQATSVSGSMETTTIDIGLEPAGLSYRAGTTGLALSLSGASIPFPELDLSAAEYSMGLTMPLVKSETASDFGLLMRVVDLALPAEVWGMIDPGAALPRDPATLIVETKGKARLFRDLTDQSAPADAMPGQVESISIDALQLKLAGADLTGTGAFTFDNADMQTFPGMPRPAGSADLKLTGGNTLLDKLVSLGLVPQDQVMGIRMALALFARPGDGPDTLTSKIEITPDAQILANGQRIQ